MGLAGHCHENLALLKYLPQNVLESMIILHGDTIRICWYENWSKGLEMSQNNLENKVIRQVG